MKKYLFVLLAFFSLSAFADKPVVGDVWLESPAFPVYGDTVVFGVVTSKTQGPVDTSLSCFQEGRTVYFNRDEPTHTYVLSDEADPGWRWDGGPALCRVVLVYCPVMGKKAGTCEALDTEYFEVEGQ